MLKNILLIIQIQHRQYLSNLKRLIVNLTEKTLPRKHRKVDLNCSNHNETHYTQKGSDDVTITDTMT